MRWKISRFSEPDVVFSPVVAMLRCGPSSPATPLLLFYKVPQVACEGAQTDVFRSEGDQASQRDTDRLNLPVNLPRAQLADATTKQVLALPQQHITSSYTPWQSELHDQLIVFEPALNCCERSSTIDRAIR